MTKKIRRGLELGNWKLIKFLGEGGNGVVWLAQNSSEQQATIKILAKLEGKNKKNICSL